MNAILLTCEHGGHRIPSPYRSLFRGARDVLTTHRAWDIGALAVARQLARAWRVPLFYSQVSRLLVDLNRSARHARVFSGYTGDLPAAEKQRIMSRHYSPYRRQVEAWIARRLAADRRVLHLSIHSFTPEMDGEVRSAELGLLYDPGRAGERAFAQKAQAGLSVPCAATGWRVRRNYPYLGKSDGFVTHLRRRFPASGYVGVELEMNQALLGSAAGQRRMARLLAEHLPVQ